MSGRGKKRRLPKLPAWLSSAGPETKSDTESGSEEEDMEFLGASPSSWRFEPIEAKAETGTEAEMEDPRPAAEDVYLWGPVSAPRVALDDLERRASPLDADDALRDFHVMMKLWKTARLASRQQEAVQRFAREYLGTRINVKCPGTMYRLVIVDERHLQKWNIVPSRVVSAIPEIKWSWHVPIGLIRRDERHFFHACEERLPGFGMEVVVMIASDGHAYGYDASADGDRSVFRLCDKPADALTVGVGRVRSLMYTLPHLLDYETVRFNGWVPNDFFRHLLDANPDRRELLYHAYKNAGRHVGWVSCGSFLFVVTDQHRCPEILSYLPERFLRESIQAAGFCVLGLSSYGGGRVVLMHVKVSGIYHLLPDGRVMLVAECIRSYLRSVRDAELEVPKVVYYAPESRFRCPMWHCCKLPVSVPYTLPGPAVVELAKRFRHEPPVPEMDSGEKLRAEAALLACLEGGSG